MGESFSNWKTDCKFYSVISVTPIAETDALIRAHGENTGEGFYYPQGWQIKKRRSFDIVQ
jgi:hypothetical protein